MTKRILVTGAAGFIGSHIVDRFINEGWEVTGVDDMSAGDMNNINHNVKEFIISNFSHDSMLEKIKNKEYDVISHQAAIPRVSYSVEQPVITNAVNVQDSLALLDACKDNVSRFVFASSSSIYGNTDILPTTTDMTKNPASPYALQKSIIEDYCKMFGSLFGLQSVCLRYFNVFGPRAKGDSPYSTAVAALLDAIRDGKQLRSDGDGEQSRDLCYVDNVVQANFLASTIDKEYFGERFNVACGDRTTNNQILEFLEERFGKLNIVHAPERAGDVKHTQACIQKTIDELGYKSPVGFWDGLERTIKSMGL